MNVSPGTVDAESPTALHRVDPTFVVTLFDDQFASRKRQTTFTLVSLAEQIRTTTAMTKSDLPWLKLARFGEERTEKRSLRHDGNVLAITRIEADYDGR